MIMSKQLTVTLENPNEIHMTRTFAAPRHLVLRAMREPELMTRWMGGARARVASIEIDYRVGGGYRIVYEPKGRARFSFSGDYQEISDERVVHTERMDGAPGEALVTITLVERGGETVMDLVMRFPSQAIRDMVVATGMADGAGESYDELDRLLASL
jgi:uncharacterized protein YndB with AHSA1/START domain